MDVGARIKERRKSLGLSAERVAEMLGVSPATIYRYESSEILNMKIDKLQPIAQALKTTPAYLMGWDEENALAQEDESVWKIISADETKLHIATWVASLNHEQLLQVAKILSAILDKEIPPSALK